MASQGNYKPTTGKATGNSRRSSTGALGFFWFTLLVKTCTHGPELRSKCAYKKQDLERMGKKIAWNVSRRAGEHPREKEVIDCFMQNLWQFSWWQWDKYTLQSMKPIGTVLVHPDGQSFPQPPLLQAALTAQVPASVSPKQALEGKERRCVRG